MGISVGGERGGGGGGDLVSILWWCLALFFAHPSHKILINCSFPLLEEEVGVVVVDDEIYSTSRRMSPPVQIRIQNFSA